MASTSEPWSPPAGEPDPSVLDGRSFSARVKRGLLATRPKFLTASVLPVVVGTGWGYRQSGQLSWSIFLLALAATVLVHAASNVWNDVGDDSNGTDRLNDGRIHPYTGGSRFIQNGVLDKAAMLRLSASLGVVAVLIGLTLIWLKGVTVLWLGVTGLVLGYFYSSSRVRLNGRGIGEAAVALAFGVLPLGGAAWLQSGTFSGDTLLLAIPVSCWVAAILLVNEVPDATADSAAGKRTLAVRLGTRGTAALYRLLHSIALLGLLPLIVGGELPLLALLAPVVLMTIGLVAARKIVAGDRVVGDRAALKQSIEMTLAVHGLGCLWLAGWAWFYPL